MPQHKSVLLNEVLKWLDPKPGEVFVDGTLGLGGHAEAILEKITPGGKLIGFDKDSENLIHAKKRLERFGDAAMILHEDFRNIPQKLQESGVSKVQGLLLDLGVSSMQLDEADRGFSFSKDGPLDMRMDRQSRLTAAEIVNRYPEEDLRQILWKLGEERFARKIVEKIVQVRARHKIETTSELSSIVFQAVPAGYRHGRIHPATRTFQALRIAVNEELVSLEKFLSEAVSLLDGEARLVIISFHSLEDRIVKTSFREMAQKKIGSALTKKPLVPTKVEMDQNPRARSAKLRVFSATGGETAKGVS